MEDSGYFSRRSSEFKLSTSSGDSCRIPSPEDLFKLRFDDLVSSGYGYLRHGFRDEEDFEDFKQELRDFRRLKRRPGETPQENCRLSPGAAHRRDVNRYVKGGSSNKVTETEPTLHATREKRRDERGKVDKSKPEGRVDEELSAGEGNHAEALDCSDRVSGSTPLLKRNVSLRSSGGGARARASKKRNGVYFDDNSFQDGPASAFNSTVSNTYEPLPAEETENSGKLPDPVTLEPVAPFPVSPARRPGRDGARKVSFRETTETFASNDDYGVREAAFHPKSNTNSPRNNSALKTEDSPPCCMGTCVSNDVRISSRKSTNASEEAQTAGDRCNFSKDAFSDRCCDRQAFLQTSDSVRVPVMNYCAAGDVNASLCKQQLGDTHNTCENGAENLSAFVGRIISSLPPKVPVTSESAGRACDKINRTVVEQQSPDCVQKNEADRSRNAGNSNGNKTVTGDERNTECADSQTVERRERVNASNSKRASLLETLKRLSRHGRPVSGRALEYFMEFFSGDEHFQEFERVFETINNRRFSQDLGWGKERRWETDDDCGNLASEDDDLGILHIDETFLDFFDNDEDFLEFERELENIKSSRRSRLLEGLSHPSNCDILTDVGPFCDRNPKSRHTPNSSPKVERRLSAVNSSDCHLWNSAEEWDVVMKKLKRNSRLHNVGCKNSEDCLPVTKNISSQFLVADDGGHFGQCPCVKDCQYTCHSHCVPSVTLDCTTVSPGSTEGPVATPNDLPSPYGSAETSLTEQRPLHRHTAPQDLEHFSTAKSELPSQTLTHNVQHLPPPGAARRVSSPPQNVLPSTSERDPLLGAHMSQTASSSSSSVPSAAASQTSVCVDRDLNQNAKNLDGGSLRESRSGVDASEATNEKDETDSGYRSGTIPDEKLPKAPSQATLNRKELRRIIETFNHYVPKAALETVDDGETFQGFLRVTLNLVRPITMELGARPPSIYELLTREHIVEQSTQHIAFYMPRDTVKSIHIDCKTTTREVIKRLLDKFHIVDNPRKFAMYEQVFNDKNKLVKLRRLTDKDFPLVALLSWEPEHIKHYRLVLQENETGEIVWDAFSQPELKNFMIVLDREEKEAIAQLQYKYRVMKRIIIQRMKELRKDRSSPSESSA